MKTSSKKIPENSKARVGVSLDQKQKGWLYARCFEANITVSQFVENCIKLAQKSDEELRKILFNKE